MGFGPSLVKAPAWSASAFGALALAIVLAALWAPSASSLPAVPAADYRALAPARLLDTRPGGVTIDGQQQAGGAVGPGGQVDLTVVGRGGVPASGVAAVVLNVTVTAPTAPGWVGAFATGTTRPPTSNVNFAPGQTVANLMVAKVGAGGRVTLYNSTGSVQLIADVEGWIPATTRFGATTPTRLLDTRSYGVTGDGQFQAQGPLSAGAMVDLTVLGRGGVPATGVDSVILNLTATEPTGPSFVTAYPSGQARPDTSNLNMAGGQTIANLVSVKVGALGKVAIYNSTNTTHLVIDVFAWTPTGSDLNGLAPVRLADTRPGQTTVDGQQAGGGALPAGGQLELSVLGRGGVPADGVGAVVLNLTVTSPAAEGWLTAFPGGTPRPLASNLNYGSGQTIAGSAILRVGANGMVSIYSAAATHVIADVVGWLPNPLSTSAPTLSTQEDMNGSVTVTAVDRDGGAVAFTITSPPSHGALGPIGSPACDSLTPSTCTIVVSYAPAPTFNGADAFTVQAVDGEAYQSTTTVAVSVTSVNDAPSFTKGADQSVVEDSGAHAVFGWATAISAGPSNESSQALDFVVTANTNPGLFSAGPSVSPAGNLTFTSAPNANGSASITLHLHDSGGTASGGVDVSGDQTFTITVRPVNDAPSFTLSAPPSVLEDAGPQTVPGVASSISAGPPDESSQTLSFQVTDSSNPGLFSSAPALSPAGQLTYTPAPNANGTAIISVQLHDTGGVLDGGVDTSTIQTFTISVISVNDVPSFTKGADEAALVSSGAHTVPGWATAISPGPVQEAGQAVSFIVSNNLNSLFSTQPAVGPTGTLTYTLAVGQAGTATVSVQVHDDGGTANGGVDTSLVQTFNIVVAPPNQPPVAQASSPSVVEDTPAPLTLTATDPDGNPLTFALGTGSSHGSLGPIGAPSCNGLTPSTCTASVQYTPAANYAGPDTFTYTASDGIVSSSPATVSITVTPVNDAPTVTTTAAALGYNENQGPVVVDPGVAVTDPDSSDAQGAQVAITSGLNNTQDVLAFSNQLGITGSFNATTGVLTLSGAAPIGDYQTALRSVTYANTSDAPQSLSRTIGYSVQDSAGATSTTASRDIAITAVNDPPVNNGVPGTTTVTEDTDLSLTTISVSDPDAGGSPVKVSLDVTRGTLTFASTTGLNLVDGTGNGAASVHFTGTMSAINTAMAGLKYRGSSNYNNTQGAEVFTILTSDQGNSGTGGPLSDTDTFGIDVTPVNDAPSAPTQSFSAETNMRRSITVPLSGAAGPTDPDVVDGGYTPAFTLATVTNGACAGCVISNLNLAAGTFDIDPPAGLTGAFNLSYTVMDSGNPGPGATSSAATITLNVSGPVIWFVDSTAPSGGNGIWTGTNAKAFQTVGQAAAVDGADHRVFVLNNSPSSISYADGLALNQGEWLIGQGVPGASFDSVLAVTPPAGTAPRPAVSGARPTLQGTVTLNTQSATNVVKVLGLNLSTGASAALTNAGTTVNGVTVDLGSVATTSGTAVNITGSSNGAAAPNSFTLLSVSANGAPNGIVLVNATGSFTVTGDAGSANNASGGTIQNAGSYGISIVGSQDVSLDQMNIQNTVSSGIDGRQVNGFSLTNSTVDNSGTGHGVDASNIGFNTTGTGTEVNLTGAVTIKGNTLTNAFYQGIDIFNYGGTITTADISNNTLTSGTTTGGGGTSVGSGIRFVAFGSGSAAASITKATIDNNSINNFPGAVGLQVQCGNANSAAAPPSTCGTAGDPANVVKITNNKVNAPGGGSAVKTGAEGIIALVNGVGQGNFDISNNNVQNTTGISISSSAFGNAVVSETITSNTVVSNNTVASQGIGIGTSTTGGFATNSPRLSAVIASNNVSQTDGNGILAVSRDSSDGKLDVSIKANTVAAPLTGVRPGIRIDAGNSTGNNDVCAVVAANTSAGSGGVAGIGLRKQGTSPTVNVFGVEGMSATASPGVESYVSGLNPASTGGTFLISATSGFTNCSTAP